MDLVSIITPSYKSERFIAECIESVLAQTYRDWEMIIVDDCSPDNSNEIVQKYIERDDRIKLFKLEKNSGAAVARNRAIEEAKGRFIAFLDADDLWVKEKLEKQIAFMLQKKIAFSFSEYVKIDENSQVISDVIHRPSKVDYKKMLKSNYIPCLSVIYDTQTLGKVYMPLILKRQDYALWLKLLKTTEYAYCLNEPLAKYRFYSGSLSSNKFVAAMYVWKLYTKIEKLNFFQASYYFLNYIVISFIKYKK